MNKEQEETRIEFTEKYQNMDKIVHIRPTDAIYKPLCDSLCDLATKEQKWGYVWFHGMVLAFDLSLFRQTGGQVIPM